MAGIISAATPCNAASTAIEHVVVDLEGPRCLNHTLDDVLAHHPEHSHALRLTLTSPADGNWECDVCWGHNSLDRYRCVEGCQWSICAHCLNSPELNAKAPDSVLSSTAIAHVDFSIAGDHPLLSGYSFLTTSY